MNQKYRAYRHIEGVWGVQNTAGCTDVWGHIDVWWHTDVQRGVQMYGGVYRCIRHRDIRWDIWDVHRYRGHTDVLG